MFTEEILMSKRHDVLSESDGEQRGDDVTVITVLYGNPTLFQWGGLGGAVGSANLRRRRSVISDILDLKLHDCP